ncbi:MAG TPA: hypothetical protein VK189_08785 [Thermoplasmata archaeon]|nr:hypothetical protein [Thermoplasmata archaeon]
MKRLRFLWWIYTVRGTDPAYLEVESRFGLKTVYSLGRWVLANLLALAFLTSFVLITFIRWRETGDPIVLVVGTTFAILLAIGIAFFAWSMTPSR